MILGINSLSVGPILFPLTPPKILAFYKEVALNPLINRVFLGEIVCPKRKKLLDKYWDEIFQLLKDANKEIILSTPILNNNIESQNILDATLALANEKNLMLELNDLSLISKLQDQKFCIGPYVNTYNHETIQVFSKKGCSFVCPPFELSKEDLFSLAKNAVIPLEVTIFGQIPLAISARCFNARYYGRYRNNCKLVCTKDINGLVLNSIDDKALFCSNGPQVLSHKCYNLIANIKELMQNKISNFRILPTGLYPLEQITSWIQQMMLTEEIPIEFNNHANGFYYDIQGYKYILTL